MSLPSCAGGCWRAASHPSSEAARTGPPQDWSCVCKGAIPLHQGTRQLLVLPQAEQMQDKGTWVLPGVLEGTRGSRVGAWLTPKVT